MLLLLVGCGSESGDAPKEGTDNEEASASQATAESTEPTRLTNLEGASRPLFSPDGTKIVVGNLPGGSRLIQGNVLYPIPGDHWGGVRELYVMNTDGTDASRVVEDSDVGDFAFSPDGKKIAFLVAGRGTRSFAPGAYVINVDGTGGIQLFNGSLVPTQLGWSPDSDKIAFAGARDLYTVNADGTNLTKLTNDPSVSYLYPSFSPDGKLGFYGATTSGGEFIVMNPDGTDHTRLTNGAPGTFSRFSPDGTKIVFSATPSIYVMSASGTDLTTLTTQAAEDPHPFTFTPDSKKIAFKTIQDGNEEIYEVNLDGTGLTNLTNDPSTNDFQPAFSPDGKEMAFVKGSNDASGKYVHDVYVMNIDSSQ